MILVLYVAKKLFCKKTDFQYKPTETLNTSGFQSIQISHPLLGSANKIMLQS